MEKTLIYKINWKDLRWKEIQVSNSENLFIS